MSEITPEQAKKMLKTLVKAEKEFVEGFDEIMDGTLDLHNKTCSSCKEFKNRFEFWDTRGICAEQHDYDWQNHPDISSVTCHCGITKLKPDHVKVFEADLKIALEALEEIRDGPKNITRECMIAHEVLEKISFNKLV